MPTNSKSSFVSSPLEFVRKIVKSHRDNNPLAKIKMAIWLNPINDPIYLLKGIQLLEIAQNIPMDDNPDFRPTKFAGRPEFPPLELILTSPGEINFALELGHPFVTSLDNNLRKGTAKVVYPTLRTTSDYDAYNNLIGP